MPAIAIDYALYLVSGRDLLPHGQPFAPTLAATLRSGINLVPLHEKTTNTGEFLTVARETQAICYMHNIALLISDRVDIVLEVGAAGEHVGQDDMNARDVRKRLPAGTIVSVSCNSADDVRRTIADGTDYIGIGLVYGTATKNINNPLLGPRAVGPLLALLDGTDVRAVAVSSINTGNLAQMLQGSSLVLWPAGTPARCRQLLDGVIRAMEGLKEINPLVLHAEIGGRLDIVVLAWSDDSTMLLEFVDSVVPEEWLASRNSPNEGMEEMVNVGYRRRMVRSQV